MSMDTDIEQFLEILTRELGGVEVALVGLDVDDEPPEGALRFVVPIGELRVMAPDGGDLDDMRHRIEVLIECFHDTLSLDVPDDRGRPRPSIGALLKESLEDLARRTGALDALVIDYNSPMIWASAVAGAMPEHRAKQPGSEQADVVSLFPEPGASDLEVAESPHPPDSGTSERSTLPRSSRRAIEYFRALENLPPCRGGRPRTVLRDEELGLAARSFATIYALLLVFQGDFDELNADRSIRLALPRIERLVLALPTIDPTPDQPRRMAAALRRIT